MPHNEPARTTSRRPRSRLLAVFVAVGAALTGLLGYQSLAASSSSATAPVTARPSTHPPKDAGHADRKDAHGPAGGVVPDGTTVFDDVPAVVNLHAGLLSALRRAATDASDDGVTFDINSGWRSAAYQERLLRDAVSKYGSEEEAARWVATPETSAHVSGDAVDLGTDAATWLSEHGAGYGLCRIYGNERWHFELRPEAADQGCPAMYADAAHDPRMRR